MNLQDDIEERNLRKLNLKPEYNTEDDNIINDFYVPCLNCSEKYDRAVGYFRANIYRELGEDLLNFIINGGKVRLICSPDMPEKDEEAARDGYELRGKTSKTEQESTLVYVLKLMSNNPEESDCLEMLRIMIETGSMDLFVATRSGGIYHRKIGVFYDSFGNCVAFSGSGNETRKALSSIEDWSNDEEFDVYRSWGNDFEARKSIKKRDYFQKLVDNGSKNTEVRPLNRIEREELAKFRKYSSMEDCRNGAHSRHPSSKIFKPENDLDFEDKNNRIEIDGKPITPHYYQIQAIKEWNTHNRVGMISMATGMGKTYTALFAVSDILEKGNLVLITVPSSLLLEQWYSAVSKFYSDVPILLAGGGNNWKKNSDKRMFVSDINKPRIIIATMQTASTDDFIVFVNQAKRLTIIADEAHRLGSNVFRKILENISYESILGLSATPERLFDKTGNEVIQKSFGSKLVFDLPIWGTVKLKANDINEIPILGNFLSRYNYYVETVDLNLDEKDEWERLTKQISILISRNPKLISDDSLLGDSEELEQLFIKRSRILKKAQGKIAIASRVIEEKYEQNNRWIIYCEDEDQMNAVAGSISEKNKDIIVLKYHSKMNEKEKQSTLLYFERHPSIIVSINCLDEGIDIPVVDGALILASSINPRQYVQRRGRVLRKAEGKRVATIIDTLVLPDPISFEKSPLPIVRGEISRAWNFAKNAENSDITHEIWKIGNIYGVEFVSDYLIGLIDSIEG